MKTAKKRRKSSIRIYRHYPAYPNAADTSYFTGKLLDILTAVVSGIGFVVAMLFFVTMI